MTTAQELLELAADYADARTAAQWGTPGAPDLGEIAGRFGVALDAYVTEASDRQLAGS